MKLKLSEIKPNPYKKEINGGALNEEQVERIMANLQELGLMGSLPVFKNGNNYHLIAGHHRLEALRRVYGKDYEVAVTVHEYDDETVMRGMIVENLSQRKQDFEELLENLLLIKKHLESEAAVATPDSRLINGKKAGPQHIQDPGSCRSIERWLNKHGTVIKKDKIADTLRIYEKGHKLLVEKVKEGSIGVEAAAAITRIENKNEQAAIAGILAKNAQELGQKDRWVNEYLAADENVKEKILSGKVAPEDLKHEQHKAQWLDEVKEKPDDELIVVKAKDVIDELRDELTSLNKEFDRFFYKVDIVRRKGWKWMDVKAKDDLNNFVDRSLERIQVYNDKFIKLREELSEVSGR